MHLLITRPEPDASAMRAMLEAEGVTSDLAPLLQIAVNVPDADQLARASIIVVTSRNGLRALETSPLLPELLSRPLLVVGRGSGEAARSIGFRDVTVGPATARDLLPLIEVAWREKVLPGMGSVVPGPVLHLCGDKISFDLEPPLTACGIPFARDTVYRSQAIGELPDEVAETLRHGGYDGVVLMSPLTADTYVDLVLANGLTNGARSAACLCLSQGIAVRLAPLCVEHVKVTAKPNIEEMLALIRELAAQSALMSPGGLRSDDRD